MSFQIRVNGDVFTLWETASITRSLDENCGKFQFTSSDTAPAGFPVRVGDLVQILIDGVSRVRGYVDQLDATVSTSSHSVSVSGRDVVQDLIDSSVPDVAKVITGPISIEGVAQALIDAIGANIGIESAVTGLEAFRGDDLLTADSGAQCMSFLEKFARKRQVYLTTNGRGDLRIFRPGEVKFATPLIQIPGDARNNVLDSKATYSTTDRFGTYVVRSQDNPAANPNADYKGDGVSRTGRSTDSQVRPSRYSEIEGEEAMSDAECAQRANEESTISRARSVVYECTVQGTAGADGELWDYGKLVDVRDDIMGVRGAFLIRSVASSISLNGGTTSRIVCAPPDAFTQDGDASTRTTRTARASPQFVGEPVVSQGFRR